MSSVLMRAGKLGLSDSLMGSGDSAAGAERSVGPGFAARVSCTFGRVPDTFALASSEFGSDVMLVLIVLLENDGAAAQHGAQRRGGRWCKHERVSGRANR